MLSPTEAVVPSLTVGDAQHSVGRVKGQGLKPSTPSAHALIFMVECRQRCHHFLNALWLRLKCNNIHQPENRSSEHDFPITSKNQTVM